MPNRHSFRSSVGSHFIFSEKLYAYSQKHVSWLYVYKYICVPVVAYIVLTKPKLETGDEPRLVTTFLFSITAIASSHPTLSSTCKGIHHAHSGNNSLPDSPYALNHQPCAASKIIKIISAGSLYWKFQRLALLMHAWVNWAVFLVWFAMNHIRFLWYWPTAVEKLTSQIIKRNCTLFTT